MGLKFIGLLVICLLVTAGVVWIVQNVRFESRDRENDNE